MSFSMSEAMRNPVSAQALMQDGLVKQLHCAMPGIVVEFNKGECTAIVTPAIKEILDGVMQPLPELECPVFMPGGFQFEVNPGDECLVIFCDTAIDSWWASGGVQAPSSLRRHNLSDGFALIGFFSRPRAASVEDEMASKKWVHEEIRKAMAALGGGN